MDSDENITDGLLSKSLARGDIRMREAVHKLNRGRGPPTHFRGSDKWNGGIDGIWVQDDLEVVGTSFLPFDSDLGDHRPVVNDVLSRSVLVVPKKVIVRPKARRLPPGYQESKINTFNLLKWSSRSGRSRKKVEVTRRKGHFPMMWKLVDKYKVNQFRCIYLKRTC
jgi:hypothetical protein